MKRLSVLLAACACALGAFAGKIAMQDWVLEQLSRLGVHVSTATTVNHTDGTFTVSVPFTSEYLPDCVSLSLTFTSPRILSATPDLRQPLLRMVTLKAATPDGSDSLDITLTQGSWTDAAGNVHYFNFGSGFTFTWPEGLPEVPPTEHVCDLDENCNCIGYNRKLTYPDDYPEEYRLLTMDDFDGAAFEDITSWIDPDTWPDQTTTAGRTRYWITDDDGNRLNLEQIGKTDLWRNAVAEVEDKINERLQQCCEAYMESVVCDQPNPQHNYQPHTCGGNSWQVCANNAAHRIGTEEHQFPGSSFTESHHWCVCGAQNEGHGSLISSGRTVTSTGWYDTLSCPKRCGYTKTRTHTHHFVNCGTCDADDDCDTICTGCGGDHDFGYRTLATCARCECETTDGCDAHPDDIEQHTGWEDCGEFDETGNDTTAAGAHCRCQCRTFGHDAGTGHYYGEVDEAERWEKFDEYDHIEITDKCKRCNHKRGTKRPHNWPEEPGTYVIVSDEQCKPVYICTKCGARKEEKPTAHVRGERVVCVNLSDSICRWTYKCANCGAFIHDDTHGHTRGDDCHCENGCNYLFDHIWEQNACGNEKCSVCGESNSAKPTSHIGWTDSGSGSHTCACGDETEPHGVLVYAGRTSTASGWEDSYQCGKCGYIESRAHVHHFTNCGICDAGGGCDTICTGCGGKHIFGSVSSGACAKCECPTCSDCNAHPSGDMSQHTGWAPCSEDVEEDNDDGTASGAHCQCQCLTYGHNAGTSHDYQQQSGAAEYEDFDDDDHLHVLGQCSRCEKWRKLKEAHSYPAEPDSHSYISDEACRWIYKCTADGCTHVKREDNHAHSLEAEPSVFENVSATICRYKTKCENCDGYISDDTHGHDIGQEATRYVNVSESVCRQVKECAKGCGYTENDDTHGHERDNSNCKCTNGCGFQFEHDFISDACGNRSCRYCKTPEDSEVSSADLQHSGWADNGDGTHTCACGAQTEGHGTLVPVPGGGAITATGWTIEYACPKGCGYTETYTHTHHFTNCGNCDAGDGCSVACTGCGGRHVFGSPSGSVCAKCECQTSNDCTAHPSDIGQHKGWAPCSQDVESDNFDGTASGTHCQCACLMFGHNAGTGHDYQRLSSASGYSVYDDENHLHHVGKCSRCKKDKKEKEPHTYPEQADSYGTGTEDACPWILKCVCGHEKEEIHGHDFDEGKASIETYGGTTHIVVTFTCKNCLYSYDDENEQPCYHKEVVVENGEVTGFGDSLWYDCECSNCHTNRAHSFTVEVPQSGACSKWRCANENGDGTLCSVTTNLVTGTHAGWTDLDPAEPEESEEQKGHQCFCTLKTEGHSRTEAQSEQYDCVKNIQCPAPPDGCGHIFERVHTPELVVCGSNVFCAKCGRRREKSGDDYEWVDAGSDTHRWGGKPEAERTVCVCDCGLVTSHYFAPDRAGCGCECGGELSHIAGNDPTCYCTGDPSHAKVLIQHGAQTASASVTTNHCNSCGKNWTDKTTTFTCTVCNEEVRSVVERGKHVCSSGYETTAGTITISWGAYQRGYDWEDEEDIEQVEAGSETSSWGGGGGGGCEAWTADSTLSAGGATIIIEESGYYSLQATIDDEGTVSVGSLSASGGENWTVPGQAVIGWLDAGPVGVSASVTSGEGPIGFGYSLTYLGTTKP